MGMLDNLKTLSEEPYNKLTVILGKPGSGKTTLAGTFPKPMLYVQLGGDGGAVVLEQYADDGDIKVLDIDSDKLSIYAKVFQLLNELSTTKTPFKSVVFDAYSSIEEDLVQWLERNKGARLNLQERGDIGQKMLDLRDKIVTLSRTTDCEYVLVCHVKQIEDSDNTEGGQTIRYIPKMTVNNGNKLLERASNVVYCARKIVRNDKGELTVKFVTYIGAHPNIDTKTRTKKKNTETKNGIYVSDCTYETIQDVINGKLTYACDIVENLISNNEGENEND